MALVLKDMKDNPLTPLQIGKFLVENSVARIMWHDLSAEEKSSVQAIIVTTTPSWVLYTGAITRVQREALVVGRDVRKVVDVLNQIRKQFLK